MEEFKLIVASNIIKLRTAAGMTQAELGDKISYSDKTVSKWERGESIPDTFVLKQIADIFGVTVDFMITSHDTWEDIELKEQNERTNISIHDIITVITVASEFLAAFLVYVIFWIMDLRKPWEIFVYCMPVVLVTWLILNSIWHKGKRNGIIVALLVLCVFAVVYVALLKYNPWQLFIVAAIAEVIVGLSFLTVKLKKM